MTSRTDRILAVVADEYKTSVAVLLGAIKFRPFPEARHVAMFLARTFTQLSFSQIGKAYGGKAGPSVFNAVQDVTKRLAIDPTLAARIERIKKGLNL